jgi:hypothetical protein
MFHNAWPEDLEVDFPPAKQQRESPLAAAISNENRSQGTTLTINKDIISGRKSQCEHVNLLVLAES